MTMKRICLVPVDRGTYGKDYNITLDLFLDSAGLPTGPETAHGVWGGMGEDSSSIVPFLLRKDGTIDLGTGYDGPDREGSSTFRTGRAFSVGEFFEVVYEGNEIGYRVDRIVDLT